MDVRSDQAPTDTHTHTHKVWYKTEPYSKMSVANIIHDVCYQHLRPPFANFQDNPSEEGPPPLSLQKLCAGGSW